MLNVGMKPHAHRCPGGVGIYGERALTVANRRMEGGEEVADITAESSSLTATEIGGDLISQANR